MAQEPHKDWTASQVSEACAPNARDQRIAIKEVCERSYEADYRSVSELKARLPTKRVLLLCWCIISPR